MGEPYHFIWDLALCLFWDPALSLFLVFGYVIVWYSAQSFFGIRFLDFSGFGSKLNWFRVLRLIRIRR